MLTQQGQFRTPRNFNLAWGALLPVQEKSPAVAAPYIFKAPAYYSTRVVSLHVVLKTSAQAATRQPTVMLRDAAGNIYYEQTTPNGIEASKSVGITIAPGANVSAPAANSSQTLAIPDLLLPPEYQVELVIGSIQTEDEIIKCNALYEGFEDEQCHPLAEIARDVHKLLIAERAIEYESS